MFRAVKRRPDRLPKRQALGLGVEPVLFSATTSGSFSGTSSLTFSGCVNGFDFGVSSFFAGSSFLVFFELFGILADFGFDS